jgi:hypothetical protein
MGQHPTPISDKEKQRIAAAIGSGVPVLHLHRSGRFPGVSKLAMTAIADEMEVVRKRQPGNRREARAARRDGAVIEKGNI